MPELPQEVQAAFDQLADHIVAVHGAVQDAQAAQAEILQTAIVGAFTQIVKNDELMETCTSRFLTSLNGIMTKQAGAWTMDQLKAIPRRLFWLLIGFVAIWKTGGLAAAVKFLGAIWAGISTSKE